MPGDVVPAVARRLLLALAAVVCVAYARSNSTIAGRFVTYVDTKGINWAAQPPTPIVNIVPTSYDTVHASFYLPSLSKNVDFAYVAANPNPIYGGVAFVKQMHAANKRVVLSVGGATELPTTADYFTTNEPVALAATLAKIVTDLSLDGIDLDYEDDYSNANPGLTGYGDMDTRSVGGGPAIDWLCTLSTHLRSALPKSQGYTISHAPQAPYFDLGYAQIEKKCGDAIDYYGVQFYNQGDNTAGAAAYTSAATLIKKESIMLKKSVVNPVDGSLTDIISIQGVPASKILIGKPVGTGDANNGYVDPDTLSSFVGQAKQAFPDLGGAMGWQWGSDTDGAWIGKLAGHW